MTFKIRRETAIAFPPGPLFLQVNQFPIAKIENHEELELPLPQTANNKLRIKWDNRSQVAVTEGDVLVISSNLTYFICYILGLAAMVTSLLSTSTTWQWASLILGVGLIAFAVFTQPRYHIRSQK